MPSVEKMIEVKAPISAVYNQWTQFEEFPRFMEGVKEVQQLDDRRLRWRAEIGGQEVEWEALIADQVLEHHIAWRSTSGVKNNGIVTFEPVDASRTRVALRIEYQPEGAAQKVADWVGLLGARIEGDLQRFKEFIESRGIETGAWRGEIQAGVVKRD